MVLHSFSLSCAHASNVHELRAQNEILHVYYNTTSAAH